MDTSGVILLVLLLGTLNTVQCQYEVSKSEDFEGSSPIDDIPEEEKYTVSALIERANKNAGQELDDPEIIEGDIAVDTGFQNAAPCTSRRHRNCKWYRSKDGRVYVPYVISSQYSSREKAIIVKAMNSFANATCVRFRPRKRRRSKDRDYLYIKSKRGCWSYVGRRGRRQIVSLARRGCVYHQVIQHELLHALGFHHEQARSDRDMHVRILYENIKQGKKRNFKKIKTNNMDTPYDYGSVMHYSRSVMHYSRYAFSRNRQPTIVPIPDANVAIGRATQMSSWDIARINRLYGCEAPVLV
ncbi:low choriolytic enzyme-like isoform X1 [Alosa sapidissima]|uniref:low choriolytic enzyme-like isoform X1 n=1 Tax=Alosa sapidissima TaxID=34773 RepID=UPI001C090A7C|nr:low choriolytic enzyme-like isoform X1 [Alosa sapidissima]